MKRKISMYCVLIFTICVVSLSFSLPVNAQSRADQAKELAEIRKAIKDKGAKWIANETFISKLSREEAKKLCGAIFTLGPESGLSASGDQAAANPEPAPVGVPSELDWRAEGVVTPIKDQGYCGSCWAFAAVGAMESKILLTGGDADDLSEQFVVSCDNYNMGCDGGYMGYVYDFLTYIGTTDEACFLYTSGDAGVVPDCGDRCTDWEDRIERLSGWTAVRAPLHPRKGVTNIIGALQSGPIAATFTVYDDFRYYDEGIYQHSWGDALGGHAIDIVGYGEEEGIGYWICKNSWGGSSEFINPDTGETVIWGEGYGDDPGDDPGGYFRIAWYDSGIGGNSAIFHYDPPPECTIDTDCPNDGDVCCSGECVRPACETTNCDDGKNCTTDTCSGTCAAICTHTPDNCCGNDICESEFDETSETCPDDCTSSCLEFKELCTDTSQCCPGLACVGKPGRKSCK